MKEETGTEGVSTAPTGPSETLRGRRAILLGPAPTSRRSLAHEFGHLLGFNDAYPRGYQGEPDDPFGVVLVEWRGLVDDLMGDSERGRVTGEMIDTLIRSYPPSGSR